MADGLHRSFQLLYHSFPSLQTLIALPVPCDEPPRVSDIGGITELYIPMPFRVQLVVDDLTLYL